MKIYLIAIVIAILAVSGILLFSRNDGDSPLGFGGSNTLYRNLVNSSSTVHSVADGLWATNPVPVVAANTGRLWGEYCKLYGKDSFWLHLTNVTSSGIGINEGIELTTTTPCLTLDSEGLWLGGIWAIGNTTSTLIYSEASE